MRVLFLDIDGVLNNSSFRSEFGDFDSNKVRLLLKIVKKTSCIIVISSNWKLGPIDSIKDGIRLRKFENSLTENESSLIIDSIIGITDDIDMYDRAVEIHAWLTNAEDEGMVIDSWCAIDDLPLNLIDAHFVQTNDDIGLTESLADIVIQNLIR
jgi:hypothetical protein